jgi:hypothetical protein
MKAGGNIADRAITAYEKAAAAERERDGLRAALEKIANSYESIPFEPGELTPDGAPTNRALARAALGEGAK